MPIFFYMVSLHDAEKGQEKEKTGIYEYLRNFCIKMIGSQKHIKACQLWRNDTVTSKWFAGVPARLTPLPAFDALVPKATRPK
jgi:hypothetical protein